MGETRTVTVTHMEMTASPGLLPRPPHGPLALMRLGAPPPHFYRYLFNEIGREYLWHYQRKLSNPELSVILEDENVEIFVLYFRGAPAGFFELDFRKMPVAELVFLGLFPEHTGRGFGKYLLREAIRRAWERKPGKLIVQTSSGDHPRALALYQRHGFIPVARAKAELKETVP